MAKNKTAISVIKLVMKIYKIYQDYPHFSKKPPVAPYITTEILKFGLVMDAEILSRFTTSISVDQYHKAISMFLDKILFSDPTDYQQILGLQSPTDNKLIEKHYGLLIGLLQKPEIRTADNKKNLAILDKAYFELINLRGTSSVPRIDQPAQKKPAAPNAAKARIKTDKGAAKTETSAKPPEATEPVRKAVGGEDFRFSEPTTQTNEEKKPTRTKAAESTPRTTATKLATEAKRYNFSQLDDSRKQQINQNKPTPALTTTPIKPDSRAIKNNTVKLKPPARPTTQAMAIKQAVDLPATTVQLDDVMQLDLDDVNSKLPISRQPRYRYAQVVASLVVVALVGAAYELLYKSTPNTIATKTYAVIRDSDSLPVEKKSPPSQAVLRGQLQEIDASEIYKDQQLEVFARETIKPEGKPPVKPVKSVAAKPVKPVLARSKNYARKKVKPSPAKSMIARTEAVTRPKPAPTVVKPVMKKIDVRKKPAVTEKNTIKSLAVNLKQARPSASAKTVAKTTSGKFRESNKALAKAFLKSNIEAYPEEGIESDNTTVAQAAQKDSLAAEKSSPFAIIVNAKNNQELTAEDLKNIYFDRITTWKSGDRIELYDLPVSSKVREMFSSSVLSISARRAAQREKNKRITNSTRNIPKQKSETLVSAIVASNPNAIGYVSIKTAKSRDGIRIIYPE